MKEDLSAKIRNVIQQRQRSFKKINDNLFGLYRGHLYHLVLEIKPDNEILNESQLMPILMNLILGEGNVKVQEYDGKEYYCAEKELWGRVMRENA